jgi:hypothetical protein
MRFFRRRAEIGGSGPGGDDLVRRFGETCPVCGAGLGAPPTRDPVSGRFVAPPSLRLEVGAPDGNNRYPWRVSAIDGNFRPAVSIDPPFYGREVDYIYLLCGDGHIFPEATPVLRSHGPAADAKQHIDIWNMVAVVGAPAGGKTYLLLRMLSQNPNNTDGWETDQEERRLRRRKLTPLEEVVFTAWSKAYQETQATGRPMPATGGTPIAFPAGLLSEELHEALEAIRELIRLTVVDGDRRARTWGTGFRQPLVMRTDSQGDRTWTGAVDLPGELFLPDSRNVRQSVKLRAYDSLIWVIDPVVAAALDPFVAGSLPAEEEERKKLLGGSLRPGTTVQTPAQVIRINRDQIQIEIGQHLSLVDGLFAVDEGHSLQLLVTVTKCDLIHATLDKKGMPDAKKLTDIGRPGAVARGVFGYLAFLANRWARRALDTDQATARLLSYLHAGDGVDPSVRQARIEQIGRELLEHYSDRDNFWNLVHGGELDAVEIPAGSHLAIQPWTINVPSIGTHLDQLSRPGSASQIHLRDLIMSALGCGIAYGLGHDSALFEILREKWLNLRFFLCSPLGTVPVEVEDFHLKPLDDNDRFPGARERSAGLTQLLLSVLGKVNR